MVWTATIAKLLAIENACGHVAASDLRSTKNSIQEFDPCHGKYYLALFSSRCSRRLRSAPKIQRSVPKASQSSYLMAKISPACQLGSKTRNLKIRGEFFA
jgi:hypothetical protein